MFVKDYMTHHPIMVEPTRRVVDAQRLMAENNISQLPIVGDGKRLLGMVTREGLAMRPTQLDSMNFWELTDYLGKLNVGKAMTPLKELATIGPNDTLEDAADLMVARRVSGLPVIDEGNIVVGIITETDLLIELRRLLGAIDPGWRLVVRVPDRMGEFRKLVQVISAKNWGIMAMGCVRTPKHPESWDIMLKLRYCTREELIAAIGEIEGQELVDLRETVADE
jgi:acetoin utilization protein AcuB